jgi:hypothetical protein
MLNDVEALTARLQRLEDLEDIRATWLDYCHRVDLYDLAGLADVFTEDAEMEMVGLARSLDGTYSGRRAIIDDFYTRSLLPTAPPASTRVMTGHISTNMQIELDGDSATTLAYFFEIVDDNLVLIGTYQHRLRRDPDRWRFAFLRISVRYRARIETTHLAGQTLPEIVAKQV